MKTVTLELERSTYSECIAPEKTALEFTNNGNGCIRIKNDTHIYIIDLFELKETIEYLTTQSDKKLI